MLGGCGLLLFLFIYFIYFIYLLLFIALASIFIHIIHTYIGYRFVPPRATHFIICHINFKLSGGVTVPQ